MLKEYPTLAEIKATGKTLNVRSIEENHGGDATVLVYDVIHCDGEVCCYSPDVYGSPEEAQAAIETMGDAPAGWDVYTPKEEVILSTPITKEELLQLLGGATPVGIQCVYTVHNKDETFEVCEQPEANHVSIYLRIPCGEVVPVRDFPLDGFGLKKARMAILEIRAELGELPVEPHSALA